MVQPHTTHFDKRCVCRQVAGSRSHERRGVKPAGALRPAPPFPNKKNIAIVPSSPHPAAVCRVRPAAGVPGPHGAAHHLTGWPPGRHQGGTWGGAGQPRVQSVTTCLLCDVSFLILFPGRRWGRGGRQSRLPTTAPSRKKIPKQGGICASALTQQAAAQQPGRSTVQWKAAARVWAEHHNTMLASSHLCTLAGHSA